MSASSNNVGGKPNMEWMYEGSNSKIDREEFLLGKRITKPVNDRGDFIVEDKSRDQGIDVLEKLDFQSKLREDPLITIKQKEADRRKELLSNPIKRKRLQKILKSALQKDLKSAKRTSESESLSSSFTSGDSSYTSSKHRKHSRKKKQKSEVIYNKAKSNASIRNSLKAALMNDLKNDSSSEGSSLSTSSESLDEEAVQSRKKKQMKKSNQKHCKRSPSRQSYHRSSSTSSESLDEVAHKSCNKKHIKYSKRSSSELSYHRSDSSRTTSKSYEYSHERHKSKKYFRKEKNEDTSYQRRSPNPKSTTDSEPNSNTKSEVKKGYGLIVLKEGKTQQQSTKSDITYKRASEPKKERYIRKNKSGFTKKLSAEELEQKRKEMMADALWRNDQRKSNVKNYSKEEEKETLREDALREIQKRREGKHGNAKTFIHDMKLKQTSIGSLEDTVRRKKHSFHKNDS